MWKLGVLGIVPTADLARRQRFGWLLQLTIALHDQGKELAHDRIAVSLSSIARLPLAAFPNGGESSIGCDWQSLRY